MGRRKMGKRFDVMTDEENPQIIGSFTKESEAKAHKQKWESGKYGKTYIKVRYPR